MVLLFLHSTTRVLEFNSRYFSSYFLAEIIIWLEVMEVEGAKAD